MLNRRLQCIAINLAKGIDRLNLLLTANDLQDWENNALDDEMICTLVMSTVEHLQQKERYEFYRLVLQNLKTENTLA